jgi:hypothetical protein
VTVRDTWQVAGIRGTGSNTVTADGAPLAHQPRVQAALGWAHGAVGRRPRPSHGYRMPRSTAYPHASAVPPEGVKGCMVFGDSRSRMPVLNECVGCFADLRVHAYEL